MENIQDLKKPFRSALAVALAMLVSLVVYIVVALLLKASRPYHRPILRPETANLVRLGFYGLAILQVIIIRVIRGLFFQKSPGLSTASLGRRLMLVSIFTSVFSEVPALLGFILFLLAGLTRDLYVLVFVALVLMFMFFPRFRYWEEWAAEQQSLPAEQPRP
jgi:hypothetical protein